MGFWSTFFICGTLGLFGYGICNRLYDIKEEIKELRQTLEKKNKK